ATVWERGLFKPHVDQLRQGYRSKLAAMLSAMSQHLSGIPGVEWSAPRGGLYVWLRLPKGMDAGPEGALMQCALEEGMLYVPGEYCYPREGESRRKDTIRLSFGVQTTGQITLGIQALGRAIVRALAMR